MGYLINYLTDLRFDGERALMPATTEAGYYVYRSEYWPTLAEAEGRRDLLMRDQPPPHLEMVPIYFGPVGPPERGADEPPGLEASEWTSGAFGSPGFVVDPGRARETACIRLELGEGHSPLVYSKGIVGALDEEQQALYCQQGYVDRAITEAQRARLEAFATSAHDCSVEAKAADPQALLQAYHSCLGREMKAKGEEA